MWTFWIPFETSGKTSNCEEIFCSTFSNHLNKLILTNELLQIYLHSEHYVQIILYLINWTQKPYPVFRVQSLFPASILPPLSVPPPLTRGWCLVAARVLYVNCVISELIVKTSYKCTIVYLIQLWAVNQINKANKTFTLQVSIHTHTHKEK